MTLLPSCIKNPFQIKHRFRYKGFVIQWLHVYMKNTFDISSTTFFIIDICEFGTRNILYEYCNPVSLHS